MTSPVAPTALPAVLPSNLIPPPPPSPAWWRAGWARLTGGPRRIVGIDLARGLAIIGMILAHLTWPHAELRLAHPGTYLGIVDGRSSIPFATLAGVSIAIVSGGSSPVVDGQVVPTRLRIVVRALLIFAIGGVLNELGTPVAIILQQYAALFCCTLPFLRMRAGRLVVWAGCWAIAAPLATVVLSSLYDFATADLNLMSVQYSFSGLILSGMYPVLTWFAFMLTGMGIGRLDLRSVAVGWRLAFSGAGLATMGYGVAAVLTQLWPSLGQRERGGLTLIERAGRSFRFPDAHAYYGTGGTNELAVLPRSWAA